MDLTVYRDLNVCYYGRPIINNNNKKTLIEINVATVFTYVTDFDNEHKFTSAS